MESWVINLSSQEEVRSPSCPLLMRVDRMLDIFNSHPTYEFILPVFTFLWGSLSMNSPADQLLGRKHLRSSQVLKKHLENTCGKGILRLANSSFIPANRSSLSAAVHVPLIRAQKDATRSTYPTKTTQN